MDTDPTNQSAELQSALGFLAKLRDKDNIDPDAYDTSYLRMPVAEFEILLSFAESSFLLAAALHRLCDTIESGQIRDVQFVQSESINALKSHLSLLKSHFPVA
tara:strand:+ start:52 stop:360 length:309 start_codon:yes stop_codon:yes gene_type:complete